MAIGINSLSQGSWCFACNTGLCIHTANIAAQQQQMSAQQLHDYYSRQMRNSVQIQRDPVPTIANIPDASYPSKKKKLLLLLRR